jgi:hypothetical protein
MTRTAKIQAQAAVAHPQPVLVDPVILSSVATQSHPAAPAEPNLGENSSEAGEQKLQDVLPAINEVAQKVGGFKKLSAIADTLDGMRSSGEQGT